MRRRHVRRLMVPAEPTLVTAMNFTSAFAGLMLIDNGRPVFDLCRHRRLGCRDVCARYLCLNIFIGQHAAFVTVAFVPGRVVAIAITVERSSDRTSAAGP